MNQPETTAELALEFDAEPAQQTFIPRGEEHGEPGGGDKQLIARHTVERLVTIRNDAIMAYDEAYQAMTRAIGKLDDARQIQRAIIPAGQQLQPPSVRTFGGGDLRSQAPRRDAVHDRGARARGVHRTNARDDRCRCVGPRHRADEPREADGQEVQGRVPKQPAAKPAGVHRRERPAQPCRGSWRRRTRSSAGASPKRSPASTAGSAATWGSGSGAGSSWTGRSMYKAGGGAITGTRATPSSTSSARCSCSTERSHRKSMAGSWRSSGTIMRSMEATGRDKARSRATTSGSDGS